MAHNPGQKTKKMRRIFSTLNIQVVLVALFSIVSTFKLHAQLSDQCYQTVSPGGGHTLAIKPDGSLWAWGSNTAGQLGDGTNISRNFAVRVGRAYDWVSISAGAGHSLAIKADGTLWAWGSNSKGQLGDGTDVNKNSPMQVGTANDWASISAGGVHSLALKADGRLWAWGMDDYGQVGNGVSSPNNVYYPVQIGTDYASISAGYFHNLAIKTNGTLWAWGYTVSGQVGIGSTLVNQYYPIQIGTSTAWTVVSAGYDHSLATDADNRLWAWGDNSRGQLGIISSNKTSPTIIPGIGVSSVSAGNQFSLAISGGLLYGWGYNAYGQLGDGTNTQRNSPVRVGPATFWGSFDAGLNHAMTIGTFGSTYAWGNNYYGQLGDGTYTDRNSPGPVLCCVPTASTFTISACSSYTWAAKGNKVYTASNNTDTAMLTTVAGCDSIITLNLTINQPTFHTSTVTACGSYTWPLKGNKVYTTSATDTVKLPYTHPSTGCDIFEILNLTIVQPTASVFIVNTCSSYTWAAKGNKVYTASNYTDTIKRINAKGCDSIVTLNLTITRRSSVFSATACNSYTWAAKGNKVYTASNYTDTVMRTTAAGCDSVITLNLTVGQPAATTFTVNACSSYTWSAKGNKVYTASNNTDTIMRTTTAGCDSVVTLNLTIKQPTASVFTVTADSSYKWPAKGNKVYTASNNTDTARLINAAGCDSIVTLNLTLLHGLTNNALNFNGLYDFVYAPHTALFNITGDITLEAWIKTSQATEGYIVTKSDDGIFFAVNGGRGGSGKLSAYLTGVTTSGWVYSNATVSDGTWHHVAMTRSGATLNLYIDGILDKSATVGAGNIATGTSAIQIGIRPNYTSFNGSIDEVRIWNTVRTQAQVQAARNVELCGAQTGLVAYYKMNEGIAGGNNTALTVIADASGNMNKGTLQNFAKTGSTSNWVTSTNGITGCSVTTPKTNNALNFDGTNDFVSAPHNAALNITGDLTLEAWVKTSATTESYILTKSEDGIYFAINGAGGGSGKLSVYLVGVTSSGWVYSNATVADGTWHHVAMTRSGASINLYIDGILDRSATVGAGSISTGTSPLLIGARSNYPFFSGSIDEVRIWNTVRTQAQLQGSRSAEFCAAQAGLVAYYKMNEGIAGGINTTLTTTADSSGNGNTGTLYNFAQTGSSSNWVASTNNLTRCGATPCSSASTFTVSGCGSYTWVAKGNKVYTASNTTDTIKLINAAGCDSLVTLNLTIKQPTASTLTASACNSYTWAAKGNKVYTASNTTDTIKLTNAAGCDSVITLNLTIRQATASTFTVTADGSYTWAAKGNKLYTASNNTDTIRLVNAAGCDSVITLNLTILNGPANNTLKFDGIDDYVSVPDNALFNITGAITLEAWVRTSQATESYILTKGDDGIFFAVNGGGGGSGKLSVYLTNVTSNWVYSVKTVSDGNWHHVAMTRSGATLKLYIDGSLDKSATVGTGSIGTGTSPLLIGARPNYLYFNGSIDELRIWNTARTQAQVQAGKNAELCTAQTGLVAYYKMNEGIGGGTNTALSLTADASGNMNRGTLQNFAKTGSTSNWITSTNDVTGCSPITKTNNALNFDGTDDYVSAPHSSTLSITGNITLEAWIKTSLSTESYILTKGDDGIYFGVNGGGGGSGKLSVYLIDVTPGWVYSNATVSDGNWHHVAMTRSGASLKLYIDGNLDNSATVGTGSIAAGTSPVLIGARPGYIPFNGSIDEVRIWTTARTQAQLLAGKNAEFCAVQSGLVAYYKMNEGIAGGVNTTLTTTADSSGKGNTGTLNNFAQTGSTSNWVISTNSLIRCGAAPCTNASTFTVSACGSYTWVAKGNKVYTASNTTDTIKLINAAGCDSIVTLRLTIKQPTASTFTVSNCSSYTWVAKGNKVYTASNNTDTIKLINAAGCDSIVTLNLTIKQPTASTFTVSADGSYTWVAKGNKVYTASNTTDTIKLINAAGCDSIVTLNLTIRNLITNNALNFDGIDDQVSVSHNALFNITGDITLEAWVKTSQASESYILTKGDDGIYLAIGADGVGGKLCVYLTGVTTTSGWVYSNATISDGTWHHVAMTRSGASLNLYVDGNLDKSATVGTGSITTGTSPLLVGARPNYNSANFNGSIDEVRIWNLVRTQAQIQAAKNTEFCAAQTGLVAYYKMNEGIAGGTNTTVTTTADASGNGNTGTPNNFAKTGSTSNWIASTNGVTGCGTTTATNNALNFDGTDDRVSVSHNTLFNITGDITLEAWVKTSQASESYILTKGDDGIYLAIGADGVGGKLCVYLTGVTTTSGWVYSNATISDGTWHHVAMTRSGASLNLYVDGNLDKSATVGTGSITTGTSPLLVGARPNYNSANFNGSIDEVRIWNLVRTQAQIQAAKNTEFCAAQTGLVAYYKMNEGIAGGTNTTVTTTADASGNGNTGTPNNFTKTGSTSNWIASTNGVTGCGASPCTADVEKPVITCPAAVSGSIASGTVCTKAVTLTGPVYSDNCAVASLKWVLTGATTGNSATTGINVLTSKSFKGGVTTVTYTAKDATGNSKTCSFTVTVQDLVKPSFTSTNVNMTGDASANCQKALTIPDITFTDNCAAPVLTWTSTGATTASGNGQIGTMAFNKGITKVTYTITDAALNTRTSLFNVTISDNTLPTLVCPRDTTRSTTGTACSRTINPISPVYGDNCGVNSLTWVMTGATTGTSPTTGIRLLGSKTFNAGTTVVTYTLKDSTGNVSTCSFNVNVTAAGPCLSVTGALARNSPGETPQPGSLKAMLSPNPAKQSFTLRVETFDKSSVRVRVSDISGRILLTTAGLPEKIFRFGERFAQGSYVVEVVQGEKRAILKAVKQ